MQPKMRLHHACNNTQKTHMILIIMDYILVLFPPLAAKILKQNTMELKLTDENFSLFFRSYTRTH